MRKKQDQEKIYEVALLHFSTHGYKKTTLDDIGKDLNMTNANLYCYAKSKEALYHDSVEFAMKKWQKSVSDEVKNVEDPVKKLIALFDSSVLYLKNNDVFHKIIKNDPNIFPLFPTVDAFEDINNKSVDMLKETIKNGISKGVFTNVNVDNVANSIFALYKIIIIEGYVNSDENNLDSYYDMRNLLINGLLSH